MSRVFRYSIKKKNKQNTILSLVYIVLVYAFYSAFSFTRNFIVFIILLFLTVIDFCTIRNTAND